jgi:5-formyltetrahydrofolate cyclo-ligase
MHRASRIGIYMAAFGEVSCQPFIATAWLRGKRIFAPVLRKNALLYAPLSNGTKLSRNRYGIPEPVHTRRQLVPPQRLDIVLVPLVAFDSDLNRLGMGGGYYDRSFAFRRRQRRYRKPRLVGLGYSFQHVSHLHAAPWDVPLDRAVTETETLPPPAHRSSQTV